MTSNKIASGLQSAMQAVQDQNHTRALYEKMLHEKMLHEQQRIMADRAAGAQTIYDNGTIPAGPYTTGIIGNTVTGTVTGTVLGATGSLDAARVSADQLASPALAMPLSTAFDIWQAHMGDRWVQLQDLDKEEDPVFWRLLMLRLSRANGLLEQIPLDRYNQVAYRLRERAT